MKYLLLNLLVLVVLFGVIPSAVIFGLAGHWDLWNVWAYVVIHIVVWGFWRTLVLYLKNPDMLKEQLKPSTPGRIRWTVSRAFLVVSFAQWAITGLDQRFHWSDVVPLPSVVAGLFIFAISLGLFTWAISLNPFFSPEVLIQADRGQRVIRNGPYAIIRHPGYAGILLAVVASGVALNSLLSIIPALVYVAVTVRVTAIEDQMLREELDGYADYAAKVRYRLIPGVW